MALLKATRLLLIGAGTACVGLGVAGAVLPVVPTTPFLLLAAACFARSSERLHGALLANPAVGPTIAAWQQDRSIPRAARRNALLIIPLVFATSMMAVPSLPLRLLLLAIGAALCTFLYRLPVRDA